MYRYLKILYRRTVNKSPMITTMFILAIMMVYVFILTTRQSRPLDVIRREVVDLPVNISRDVQLATSSLSSEETISSSESKLLYSPSSKCKYDCPIDKERSLVFPTVHRERVYLTIGIPTVHRVGATYILDTLKSLIGALSAPQQREVLLLVFLADFNQTEKDLLAADLKNQFSEHIQSGLIQVIQAPASFYPSLDIKRRTYRQSEKRVKWRSKQSYDFAYMFKYAINMSDYYMQLEDDVSTKDNFLEDIKSYINVKHDWVCLEFSELGFIGKLYRTEHLEKLAYLMMLFYSEQPVDVTYLIFNELMVQPGRFIKRPTLFQHNGLTSSLTGKIQRLKDRYFVPFTKKIHGDNPPAEIVTNMETYDDFYPKFAYSKADGMFWSHGPQKDGHFFHVIFNEPQRLKRVVVITGAEQNPRDIIYEGKVEASLSSPKNQCSNNIEIGHFTKGVVDNPDLEDLVKSPVACIRILVTKTDVPWVVIREIAVFTLQSSAVKTGTSKTLVYATKNT